MLASFVVLNMIVAVILENFALSKKYAAPLAFALGLTLAITLALALALTELWLEP